MTPAAARSLCSRGLFCLAVATVLASTSPSQAEDGPTAPTAALPASPPSYGGQRPPERRGALPAHTGLEPGDKRAPQDYEGRPEETTAGEVVLWVPRVLFFPVWVVTEYLVRAPLGALTVAVEENDVIDSIAGFFTFGPDENIGIVPTAFVDFGFRPSVGVYAFWNDLFTRGNDLRASFGFGGVQFWRVGLADRIPLSMPVGTERARSFVQLEADFLDRGDLLFWGIGPRTLDDAVGGYEHVSIGGGARVHVEPWRGTFFESWLTGRHNTTDEGECADEERSFRVDDGVVVPTRSCDPPTLDTRIRAGAYAAPPSYRQAYATIKSGARVVLDSRDRRPAPGTGVAVEATVEHAAELDAPDLGGWVHWGGSAAGFVDLTGTQRVLSLTFTGRFLDALRDDYRIPFTELVGARRGEDVPDYELMRGFRPGRLLGRSAVAATLEYRWPVWAFLDGTLQTALGNTFADPHLEDFDPELLRFSFVGGIRSTNHRDHSFNFLLGFGTETFADGAKPNSMRLLLGGTTGF